MDSKTIFITGAASGLGREVSRFFANKGWFVGLADVNVDGLSETAAMLPDGKSSQHMLDVTDRDQWKVAVADFGEKTGGRMDVMFNNAGIGEGGSIHEMAPAEVDKMVAINFTGVISGAQACFEMLKATPGSCLLNTSSLAGIYGVPNLSVYSATKFGVRGLTEAWDLEWAQYGIKVRSLMPGFIDTNILSSVVEGSNKTGKERLKDAGIEVSPVTIIGQAAWDAVHGDKVHSPVNKTAKQSAFMARWFPGMLRKQMGKSAFVEEKAIKSGD